MDFCTFGMFIVDEIHFPAPKPPALNILGGAGSFAALGARLLSQSPLSKTIGWIVDAGSDFPPEIRETIARWGTSCLLRETPDRLTTRGWNGYVAGGNEKREFKYLTEKLRIDGDSLSVELLGARSFHMVCSSARCMDLVSRVEERRRVEGILGTSMWVWEPVPDLCVPEELEKCLEVLKFVDVMSPNHLELCAFFGEEGDGEGGSTNKASVEACCTELLDKGIGRDGRGSVVARAGKDGCYVANRERSAWIPAYHQDGRKVVDPTGGGNAFLGAMAVALARNAGERISDFEKVLESAVAGSVGASYAIEQIGMPSLHVDEHGTESWNGESPSKRLESFRARIGRRTV